NGQWAGRPIECAPGTFETVITTSPNVGHRVERLEPSLRGRRGEEMRETVQRRSERTAVVHDPHPLWIDAVESVLESIDVTVVGRAATPEEALELVEAHRPSLLITETQTSSNRGMTGTTLIRTACERVAALRVIVLRSSHEPADIDEAFDA